MRERYKRCWGRNIPHLWTWEFLPILVPNNKWGQLVQIKAEKSAGTGSITREIGMEIVGEIWEERSAWQLAMGYWRGNGGFK
jgi:hypothetical protein